jgi:hypothetical protein
MRVPVVQDDSLVGDGVRLALTVGGFAVDLVASAEAGEAAARLTPATRNGLSPDTRRGMLVTLATVGGALAPTACCLLLRRH